MKDALEKWKKLTKAIKFSKKKAAMVEPLRISEDDILYTIAQLTAQKKNISIQKACHHPLLNFLINKRRHVAEHDSKTFNKVVVNFESFLVQMDNPDVINAFYNFFASQQGLVLYRCSILSIRYFSRMLVRYLSQGKARYLVIFKALSQPELVTCRGQYDAVMQQILTSEDLIHMDPPDISVWVLGLINAQETTTYK